jgi:mycothiol synthase
VAEYTVRPARPDDTEPAFEILADWQRSNYGEVEIQYEMFASTVAGAAAAFVAETEAGIVGHADVDGGWIDLIVHPDARRQGIGTALLREAEGATTAPATFLTGLSTEPRAAAFAEANRYSKAWEVWLMGLDLPPELPAPDWPEGVTVRTFSEDDAQEVKDLLDLAYREEFHHHPMAFDSWRRFMLEDPMFDAEAWFLAVAEGRIVGAALNWDEGYVKDLVVHPDWRGRGLGKALMVQTLGEFSRRGLPRVTLKTDSNNPTGAWKLYERLGMGVERTYVIFQKGSV